MIENMFCLRCCAFLLEKKNLLIQPNDSALADFVAQSSASAPIAVTFTEFSVNALHDCATSGINRN